MKTNALGADHEANRSVKWKKHVWHMAIAMKSNCENAERKRNFKILLHDNAHQTLSNVDTTLLRYPILIHRLVNIFQTFDNTK